jgi:hypothetical protein
VCAVRGSDERLAFGLLYSNGVARLAATERRPGPATAAAVAVTRPWAPNATLLFSCRASSAPTKHIRRRTTGTQPALSNWSASLRSTASAAKAGHWVAV